ncbi:MAG: TetR family transcriptional regulator [Streptosporangiales bacterium]|nr:TetR family transcriptional regulator [Streptosporangiales bacterium]
MIEPVATDRALPLRERKKLRVRRTLSETALRLFIEQGFHQTTLEQLVDEAEVSMRTFFRYYSGKEAVAIAAEEELWDAYLDVVADTDADGNVLDALRHALVSALNGMDDDWERRFIATRGLAGRTPELREYSALTSIRIQEHLVDALETKLGIDSRRDVRLRLVCEFAMSAWRCGAKNWVRGLKSQARTGRGKPDATERRALLRRIEEAFDAIPSAVTLSDATR